MAGRTDVSFLFPQECHHLLKHEPRPLEELVQAEAIPRHHAPDASLDRDRRGDGVAQLGHRRWAPQASARGLTSSSATG